MSKVNCTDFDVNNIQFGQVKQQEAVSDNGSTVPFATIPIEYLYSNGTKGKLRISLPEDLLAPMGLVLRLPTKTYKQRGGTYVPKKEEASLLISFDAEGAMSSYKDEDGNPIPLQDIFDSFASNNPEEPGLMMQITQHCAKHVTENKKTIKGYSQKADYRELWSGLKGKACYPSLPTKDGEEQEGKPLCYWFNVNTYKYEGRQIRAKFVAPSKRIKGGIEIPFEDLERKRLKVTPVYEIQDVYIASDKWKIRGRIISSIVTDIQENSQDDIQLEETEELSKNSILTSRLEQQLAALQNKKNEMNTPQPPQQIVSGGDDDDIPGMDVKSMMQQFGEKLST